ncbi:MAG: hypothetical protein PVF87_01095 [Acidimicrobiia bacterium]|jgi:hypothetical protein
MTTSLQARPGSATERKPTSIKWTIGILIFLGVTALGGGIEMLVFYQGNEYLPVDMLERIPFDTYIVPGLVLGIGFGLGSLFVAWGMWRRPEIGWLGWLESLTERHWAWAGSVLIGLGFTMWMVIEVSLLGAPWAPENAGGGEPIAWVLYSVYGATALLLLILPQLRPVRSYMRGADPSR